MRQAGLAGRRNKGGTDNKFVPGPNLRAIGRNGGLINMNFDKNHYVIKELRLGEETLRYRAFLNLVYVDKPVNPPYQQMHIFAPEIYYEGGRINGYGIDSAPIFMPNYVGGYMPGDLEEPGYGKFEPDKPNAIFKALVHGYVVAVPAIRGRVQKDEKGLYNGKAPACIVDYKAAVRYLRHFAGELPGDKDKIITNGTSAGGALSSLMGTTGNHADYEPYLEALGAAKERDDIFGASCYCPIINLDHADMAYEWQFQKVNDYHRMNMRMNEGGRPSFTPVDGQMNDVQIKASGEEAALFPFYLNSLKLRDEAGNPLTLDEKGEGSFKEYLKKLVLASAQRALDKGKDLSEKTWLSVEKGKAADMDFENYVRDITRMKTAPAFDDLTMDSPENDLFGNETTNCRHFTKYSRDNSLTGGSMADEMTIKMMNPMYYVEEEGAVKAKHFRIRHGERDRDTSLAISAMLTLKLRNCGFDVDYHSPWDTPHAGDYDLEELFTWIDDICRRAV